ncbi:MAG: hypothetical protein ACXADB_11775 [Candidatus Hermodarchaeia archaeon]
MNDDTEVASRCLDYQVKLLHPSSPTSKTQRRYKFVEGTIDK